MTEWTGGAVQACEHAERIALTVPTRRLNDNIYVSNKVNNKVKKNLQNEYEVKTIIIMNLKLINYV